jgi:hypothetical protein
MKNFLKNIWQISQNALRRGMPRHLLLALAVGVPSAAQAADAVKTFPTPEAAVAALAEAAKNQDREAMRAIFGSASDDLVNPDRVQATNEFAFFSTSLDQHQRLIHESNVKCLVEVGTNGWLFPVPIVPLVGGWAFDTAAGKEEILNRRIGKNELATLKAIRVYVDAQREYASRDRDGDEVLEFAQKFTSSPGRKDGLYWAPDLDGEISPLGPLFAQAQGEGYWKRPAKPDASPEPFQGYFFKIITRQAKPAPGGAYNYVVNGNMISGFAAVAWPAEYGHSGIMTFIVNQQGRVYQKDLGPKTAKVAADMTAYAPDKTWRISKD